MNAVSVTVCVYPDGERWVCECSHAGEVLRRERFSELSAALEWFASMLDLADACASASGLSRASEECGELSTEEVAALRERARSHTGRH